MNSEGAGSSRPHRDVSFHPTEGGAILFDAVHRRLYALNPAAGLTWLCVRDGLSQLETVRTISDELGVDDEAAAEWYQTSVAMFREHHLLDHGVAPAASKSVNQSERRAPDGRNGEALYFAILDRTVRIQAAGSLQSDILSLLGLLRIERMEGSADTGHQINVDIVQIKRNQWEVIVDGYPEACCDGASIVAELERVLVEALVPASLHVLTLHAASLQTTGRTVLLAGPSGSGKTTLSIALGRAGWIFGGDEIVLMETGANFRPLPFPPCIKAESFSLVSGWFPILAKVPSHRRYGRTIKFLPFPSRPFELCPATVIFPTYRQGAAASIKRIDRFDGLQKLLAQCVFVPDEFGHADVRELQRFQHTTEYYEMTYGSCESARELLDAELTGPAGAHGEISEPSAPHCSGSA